VAVGLGVDVGVGIGVLVGSGVSVGAGAVVGVGAGVAFSPQAARIMMIESENNLSQKVRVFIDSPFLILICIL
jgi:hypothetical protein